MPDREVLLVAGLQLHQLGARGFSSRAGSSLCSGAVTELVERSISPMRIGGQRGAVEARFSSRAAACRTACPSRRCGCRVTTAWPRKSRDARQRVAEERAADVADMHRLGDIRRGEIDDDAPRRDAAGTPSRSSFDPSRRAKCADDGQLRLQPEIDEPRARDLRLLAKIVHLQLRDDVRRELARICAALAWRAASPRSTGNRQSARPARTAR